MKLRSALEPGVSLAGERRQVTALFYDVVGSTEMLVSSDPESFSARIKDFHDKARAIIVRNGGFIHLKLGDGGCCYFGYPQPFENSAEKAVLAAMELTGALEGTRLARKPKLRLRVGVATGVVVISSDGSEIIGTAPVMAARLQAEADVDSVLVADSTFQLTQSKFEYAFARISQPKGFAEPLPVWRPLWPIPVAHRLSHEIGAGSPLQGRDAEIEVLRAAWQKACSGLGQSVMIVGESGMGKSRLVADLCLEAARSAANAGQYVLQCQSRLARRPLHPFLGFMDQMLGRPISDIRDHAELSSLLSAKGFRVSEVTAKLLAAFASERSQHTAGHIKVLDISGLELRSRVIDGAVEVLSQAANRPLLIVVEDLHWADTMTLELVERLIVRTRNLSVMVVLTRRVFPDTSGQGAAAEIIVLPGLGEAAVAKIVASLWGNQPPSGLASFIFQMSDGIPLFAEELTLFLRRRASTEATAADWWRLLSESGVATLNDLLSARLADAGQARHTAQLASVLGREFTLSFLSQLLDRSDLAIESGLTVLVALGILELKDGDERSYRFRHALIQEAAYTSLLRSDCRRFHKRIAKLLITGASPGFPPDLAAWHCAEGGFPLEAARFAINAAEACVIRSAMLEASQLLQLAKEQLSKAKPDSWRTEVQLDTLQLAGVVSVAIHGEGSTEARRVYEKALSILHKHPATSLGERFALYWGWWFTAPNVATQQSRARILVDDLKLVDNPEVRLQSFHCAWATSFHAAQHDFCLRCVADGLALYDAERAHRNRALYGGHDAKVCGLGEKALSLLLTGDDTGCELAIAECLDWAGVVEHVGSALHALYYAVVLRRCQGRYQDVIRVAERMHDVAESNGMAAGLARANMFSGWAEAMSGSVERGVARFEQGVDLQRKTGTDENMSIQVDMHGEMLELNGRRAETLELLGGAITRGRKSGQLFWLPELHRRHARLRLELGGSPAAVRLELQQAIEIGQSQGAHWLVERARADLTACGAALPSDDEC